MDSFGFRVELQGLRGSTIPQVIRERGRASLGLALVCLCLRVGLYSSICDEMRLAVSRTPCCLDQSLSFKRDNK